ncbi:DUF2828 family protein [Bacillus velezensis]|uniref:DUF2828 family protein n=1 Tax=Bacillus velezensis TaxID=492670 RepID=UPI0018C6CA2A|nr:DUF2828 family protein [Bacillus velezensis]QPK89740.1 DUF2828 family protein [Bacillus velezensis]
MLNHLKNEFNKGRTANGAVSYNSTKSAVLDLFSLGGAFRNRSDEDVIRLVSASFGEDQLLTMKTLFYLRDIIEGQGERRFFRLAIKYLATHNKSALIKNLELIPKFGRWDDMWCLLETSVKDEVVKIVRRQLLSDKKSDHPSLLAKWMPSENASNLTTKKYAKILRKELGGTSQQYRKLLSSLREKINIVERKMSNKDWHTIDYSRLPSKAGLIYREAFMNHDPKGYQAYLDGLENGTQKVNAKTLYPYDIVNNALKGYSGKNIFGYEWRKTTSQDIQLLDAQWESLPDYIGENKENSIAVVDTSGSMSGTPMNVAISLGIYLAERNKGIFHNHFLTFSTRPQLQQIVGGNIVEKVRNLSDADWKGSTNIEAVFEKLLSTAVTNNVPAEEMIKKVYIISDMQFNACAIDADLYIFEEMSKRYNEAGYELPSLVFWNVNAFQNTVPFTMNEQGVQLVSGFSPSIFAQLLSADGKTPMELMLEVIDSERYAEVAV